MAVSVGRSAMKPVLAGVIVALNVAALKTGLGYTVGLYSNVTQGAAKPYARVHAIAEAPNSTFGRNGKDVTVAVDVFDDYRGDIRVYAILSQVVALLNPVGNYHAIVVAGYTVIHVDYEQSDDAGQEDIGGVGVQHLVARFRVTVEEA